MSSKIFFQRKKVWDLNVKQIQTKRKRKKGKRKYSKLLSEFI